MTTDTTSPDTIADYTLADTIADTTADIITDEAVEAIKEAPVQLTPELRAVLEAALARYETLVNPVSMGMQIAEAVVRHQMETNCNTKVDDIRFYQESRRRANSGMSYEAQCVVSKSLADNVGFMLTSRNAKFKLDHETDGLTVLAFVIDALEGTPSAQAAKVLESHLRDTLGLGDALDAAFTRASTLLFPLHIRPIGPFRFHRNFTASRICAMWKPVVNADALNCIPDTVRSIARVFPDHAYSTACTYLASAALLLVCSNPNPSLNKVTAPVSAVDIRRLFEKCYDI